MPILRTRLTVALISGVTIALELVLMRALALRFWDHFAYLIISAALLGFAASGTALTLAGPVVSPRRRGVLVALAVMLAVAIPLALRATEYVPLNVQAFTRNLLDQAGNFVLIELILTIPMFLAGAAVGVTLMDDPERIGGHYAANLLGSGAGAAGAVALLTVSTVPHAMTVLAAIACLAGLILLPWRRLGAVGAALSGVAALAAVQLLLPWEPSMSQYKTLPLLEWSGAETIHSRWGPLGRIDVLAGGAVHYVPAGFSPVCEEEIPPHVLIILDGDNSTGVFQTRSPAEFAFLDYTTAALPYHLAKCSSVLVLGGGGDIGLALYHSAGRIVAVESNRQIIDVMTGPLRQRGGGIYTAGGVEAVNIEPRGYLSESGEKFDLIQIPFVAVSSSGEAAASESYLYTVEAFELMLKRLRPGGMINITCEARTPPRGGLRLFATAVEALRRTGRQPREHLAMIRAIGTVNLTVFASPLQPEQIRAVREFCKMRNFDLCCLPDLRKEQTNLYHVLDEGYYEPCQSILGGETERYFDNYIFDVRPTYDDKPYFFRFLRPLAAVELITGLGSFGQGYLEVGYVLLVVALLESVVLAAVLIVLPLIGRAGGLRRSTGKKRAMGYFLLIGIGFMFIEMSFLQRLTLYLAHPLYSAAVVISAFLVFAGIGSGLSRRWRSPLTAIRRAGMVVAVISLVYIFVLNELLFPTQGWPVWGRAIFAAGAVAPLGVAMGHMFPIAMRCLGAYRPALVPWCWAINGFAGVVATVAAVLMAMEVGFNVVAALGAAAYLGAMIVAVPTMDERTG
ncbi:MAG: hypothetical protein SVV80_00985 [Planctomycetota bacterium]|nr:hypothetical protein [Planctomycetota bacterium]